jgi:hypothetical protein
MTRFRKVVALAVSAAMLVGSSVFVQANADVVIELPAGTLLSEWRVVSEVAAATGDNTPRVPEGLWAYRTNFQLNRTEYEHLQWTDRPIASHSDGTQLNFVFTSAPDFLIGSDWLQVPNNARSGAGTPRAEQYVVTAARPITVIVGIDHRSGVWAGSVVDGGAPVQPPAANVGTVFNDAANGDFRWLADWEMMPFSYHVINNEGHTNVLGRTDLVNPARVGEADGVPVPSVFYLWRKDLAAGESATVPSIGQGSNGNITMWIIPQAADIPDGTLVTPPPVVPGGDMPDIGEGPKADEVVPPTQQPPPTNDNVSFAFAIGAVVLLGAAVVLRKRQVA